MKESLKLLVFVFSFLTLFLQGCIHEFPHAKFVNQPGGGNNPTTMEAFIEVSYNLNWQNLIHNIDFDLSTRARTDTPHRFVIEVIKENEVISHDVVNITDQEFSTGKLNRRIPVSLSPSLYNIAVWYDMQDKDGNYAFHSENLREVSLLNRSTTDATVMQSAFASERLDLRGYDPTQEGSVSKQLEMNHAGARFEIVASDVQDFISAHKEALNQGDTYTVKLTFTDRVSSKFNLHANDLVATEENLELTGRMRLPFAEYDELKIAEGFVFCSSEEEVLAQLTVINSALVPVVQTDYFSFPVKRGHITTVTGNFLSNTVDGLFSIDNVWEGIIEIEI